jgi:hypothetical protein
MQAGDAIDDGQGLERAADARRDQPGHRQCQQAPDQPVIGNRARRALARQDQPVFFLVLLVEAAADPEAADASDLGSDPRYQGADSRVLLRAAVALLAERGWRPANVDATIIAQQKKLAPHAAAMVANAPVDLGISPDSVNIKGKTNEKLGYLGRQEAIEAQAVVLVERVL